MTLYSYIFVYNMLFYNLHVNILNATNTLWPWVIFMSMSYSQHLIVINALVKEQIRSLTKTHNTQFRSIIAFSLFIKSVTSLEERRYLLKTKRTPHNQSQNVCPMFGIKTDTQSLINDDQVCCKEMNNWLHFAVKMLTSWLASKSITECTLSGDCSRGLIFNIGLKGLFNTKKLHNLEVSGISLFYPQFTLSYLTLLLIIQYNIAISLHIHNNNSTYPCSNSYLETFKQLKNKNYTFSLRPWSLGDISA